MTEPTGRPADIIDVEAVDPAEVTGPVPVLAAPTGEIRTTSATGGMKGVKTASFDLVPPRSLGQLALFYSRSTTDFARPASWSQLFNFINAQLWGFWNGDNHDPQTGLLRTVGAAAGCLALADSLLVSPGERGFDDRPGHQGQAGVELAECHPDNRDLPRFDLIPGRPLFALSEHYQAGADKYERNNWALGFPWSHSFAAAMRHLWQFWGGEDIDAETGQPHVLATAWHALTLTEFSHTHPEFDDRLTNPGGAADTSRTPEPSAPVAESSARGWLRRRHD